MIHYIYKLLLIFMLLPVTVQAVQREKKLSVSNFKLYKAGGEIQLAADLVLDSLHLSGNRQIYVTPVIEGPGEQAVFLPAVLINGRNMHYAYLRGNMPRKKNAGYDIVYEVKRDNGKVQTLHYKAQVPVEPWMYKPDAALRLVVDTCGCGQDLGSSEDVIPLPLNPVQRMYLAYHTPEVAALPVTIHEGRARIQFEVDRTELHVSPYKCRSGQLIDNRAQIKMIEDSVNYALANENVEIAAIDICGYASPESPYIHNDYLATNRSRALAEYIGKRYNLPADKCHYSSVPENWAEFKEQVQKAGDITSRQREDLLQLIDRPAYGASDYDAKERELKTSDKFRQLYFGKILPEWFPLLRCTKFAISTRLKPLSDEALAEVIRKNPELMSLNQMFRVARLYPEGSEQFDEVIEIARKYYPEDPTANTNAAVAAMKRGDRETAARLLEKAGDLPEANNARGVIATGNGEMEAALQFFEAAGNLPEAAKNKALIEE